MKPKRIQKSRAKEWRKPEGSMIVSRPFRYGNPFKLDGGMIYCDASYTWHNSLDLWVLYDKRVYSKKEGRKKVVELYNAWIRQTLKSNRYTYCCMVAPCPFTIEDIKRELKGRDLACWCKESEKHCHAEILLKISNS